MAFIAELRDLWEQVSGGTQASSRTEATQRRQTEAFCAASTALDSQTGCLIELFSDIWRRGSERAFQSRLMSWIGMLEQDADLRSRFQQGCRSMLGSLNSVSLFAEAGIPAQHALFREITSRVFQNWLPPPRAEEDTARLFTSVLCSTRGVERFLNLDEAVFARLAAIFWSAEGLDAYPHVHQDLHEALRLLAARVSARGTSRLVRQRSATQMVEQSPSYALVFATERLIECEHSAPCKDCIESWLNAVFACRGEVALVRISMEETGANSPLVFDLGAMDAALDRMELLAATMVEHAGTDLTAVRRLLNTLVRGLLEDTRISSVIRQNFNLLARKTVERTGHGGEHYIAHSRKEYWHMWGAAIGGGFLTVFTAAIKLHIVGKHWAPFMEVVLVGTNYAVSFLLLQIFGLALATKQPAMTGATLANIINRNRGASRRAEITEFGASISRTQLAAALGNILAVSSGAVVVFNLVWLKMFHAPYVPAGQAEKVYLSLRPLASATAIDAALTGVLLWLENTGPYRRVVRELRHLPSHHSGGDCATSTPPNHWPRPEMQRGLPALGGIATSAPGRAQYLAWLPAGLLSGVCGVFWLAARRPPRDPQYRDVCLCGRSLWPLSISAGMALRGGGWHRRDVCAQPGSQLCHRFVCGAAGV